MQLAAQSVLRPPMELPDLSPQKMLDLAEGRWGAQHDGWVVTVKKPEHGHAGTETLTQAIARFKGDSLIIRHRRKHLGLFVPQLYPQYLLGKLFRGQLSW